MPRNLEVLLVDQDQEVRFSLKKLLSVTEMSIVGEASFGTEAINRAVESTPDLILCGFEQPLVRPLETIEGLLNALPSTPVVVYSSQSDVQTIRKAMLAGARDFLVHPLNPEEVETALFAALGAEEEKRIRLSGRRRSIGFKGTIVCVFSAKGGVGKTTFATNLAEALASDVGQSVVIVDGDTSFGDVTTVMGVHGETDVTHLAQEMDGSQEPDVSHYLTAHSSGAHVLAAPRNPFDWALVSEDHIRSMLELLRSNHDYVVVDLSPALNPITVAALEAASIILWILSPDVCTIHDNMEALSLLETGGIPSDKMRLILNHPNASKGDVSIQGIETTMETPVHWVIPYDLELHQRSQLGIGNGAPRKMGAGGRSVVSLAKELAGVASNGAKPRATRRRWLIPFKFGRDQEVVTP